MKVDYEVKKCDNCNKLYQTGVGIACDYTIFHKGEEIDLCDDCKVKLIQFLSKKEDEDGGE